MNGNAGIEPTTPVVRWLGTRHVDRVDPGSLVLISVPVTAGDIIVAINVFLI